MGLKVLLVSVEVSPFAKVGGLADVAGSLPKALRQLGVDVRVAMPAYKMVEEDPRWAASDVARFPVRLNSSSDTLASYAKVIDSGGVPFYLLGTDRWFNSVTRSEEVYQPGHEQYLFFSQAVLEACKALDWIPDVIHCNDWHTGFVPVAMRVKDAKFWAGTSSVFTIHNLAYQGEFGRDILDQFGLPQSHYDMHRLETFGNVNFLKSGCVYSDRVNTVSERYAEEIQIPEYGCRLDGLMRHLALHDRLSGILNGIDTEVFDPSTDLHTPAHFSAQDPSGKAQCRKALLDELGLEPIEKAPVMGVVSRVSNQKGMDLMLEVAEELFALPAQMIVLGTGDPWLASGFRGLQERFPGHLRFVERFDAPLAQRIYAGSDVFLMPSSFEPCGLGQMIAMRYGTLPVVRLTGGLADTVFEGHNGFVFEHRNSSEFLSCVARAHAAYQKSDEWQTLMHNALMGDYSWHKSATAYVELYERAVSDRKNALKSA